MGQVYWPRLTVATELKAEGGTHLRQQASPRLAVLYDSRPANESTIDGGQAT